MLVMSPCRDCDMWIDHCHGVLVEHADGSLTCDTCTSASRLTHDFVEPCGDGCCWPPAALAAAA